MFRGLKRWVVKKDSAGVEVRTSMIMPART